jgi:hypothetical protein
MSEDTKSLMGRMNTRASINIRFYKDLPLTEANEITEINYNLTEAGIPTDKKIVYVKNDSNYGLNFARIIPVYNRFQTGSIVDTLNSIYLASEENGLMPDETIENAFNICGIGNGAVGSNGGYLQGKSVCKLAIIYSPDYSVASGVKAFNLQVDGKYYSSRAGLKVTDSYLYIILRNVKTIESSMYSCGGYKTVSGLLNTEVGS